MVQLGHCRVSPAPHVSDTTLLQRNYFRRHRRNGQSAVIARIPGPRPSVVSVPGIDRRLFGYWVQSIREYHDAWYE